MIVKFNSKILKILNKINGFRIFGMVICEFIFVCEKRDKYTNKYSWDKMINHEKIHIRQYRELLYVGFPIWYGIEYLIRRIATRSHYKAYRGISLEREAYSNERNFGYLRKRKLYAWIKFLK